jgi:hypothetical protein
LIAFWFLFLLSFSIIRLEKFVRLFVAVNPPVFDCIRQAVNQTKEESIALLFQHTRVISLILPNTYWVYCLIVSTAHQPFDPAAYPRS